MPTIDNFALGSYLLDGFNPNEPAKLIKSGLNNSSAATVSGVRAFDNPNTTYSSYYLQVSNQGFGVVPRFIYIKFAGEFRGLYIRDLKNAYGSFAITDRTPLTVSGNFYVDENGFYLPVNAAGSPSLNWDAYA